ncbi:MAG: pyruvate kinase [Ilumatobacter coccineus]|uniref:Pyruvate kinase n=1 Tax=Ilumatobacter coccineus TaxID=467094 RepID=A0A2G6KE84_9ACTN|nr:MAG: pyruvate kinase [Ilumatobacter coccineus]
MTRRTKIVATIGPATDGDDQLRALIEAGVDVVRLNLSHGTVDEHLARIERVRRIAGEVGRVVGILIDLPGPKIRAGEFPTGGVIIETGRTVTVCHAEGASTGSRITVDFPVAGLVEGAKIAIGDGAITLVVTSLVPDGAVCEVLTGGRIQGRPGVHFPSDRTHLESPTDRDRELAARFAEVGVDFVAVSFVRRGTDIAVISDLVDGRAEVVAKIETQAAIGHLDELLDAADVIMVARGDLGIDCDLQDVPHLQKSIIRRCVEYGVPVVTATQMLESMLVAPVPTRAEVSDVANAVLDGTDALMLSGETAIGRYPVESVTTMSSIAERAEAEASYRQWASRLGRIQRERWDSITDRITAAVSHAAADAAFDAGVSAILCCTLSGRSVKAMARFRPESALIGLSPNPSTVGRMSLSWGVNPVVVDTYESTDEMVWFAVERALEMGCISHGDVVAVIAGAPSGQNDAAADVLRIVTVD